MGKKTTTSAITPVVNAATTKRARAVTEIDDIFASKKTKSTPPVSVVPESSKTQEGKGKGGAGRAGMEGGVVGELKQGKNDKKGKGKEIVVVALEPTGEDSEEEEEEIDDEAEEWARLEAEEQAKVDAAENLKKKRVVQEIVDPSTAIDAFRNTAGPPSGPRGGGGKGGAEGKAEEAEDRFMDSRGTARTFSTSLRIDQTSVVGADSLTFPAQVDELTTDWRFTISLNSRLD